MAVVPASTASLSAEPALRSAPAVAAAEEPRRLEAPRDAASAPLRLDAQLVRRAIAGAEGSVRALARGAGAELDSPRFTEAEHRASAVARTAVPDCLAPNANGSLLSAPAIAYAAITGKCR